MFNDDRAGPMAHRCPTSTPLELWGGAECTVNRVQDGYRDQFVATGRTGRTEELELLGQLGFAAVRHPILWEHVSPLDPTKRDWRSADRGLGVVRQQGARVIAGLIHHGSGPAYTDLLSNTFATGLADHARAVAGRYPWIGDWTPVNEPLTTARFAALYGHWYPHHRDEASFWAALLNQIDATRLAMRAIREQVPRARLIQTEDIGRTYATAPLRDQAAFDNTRRWSSLDLLCGRVVPGHHLWQRLCDFGFASRLKAIAAAPCPPDIIGINHYLTSDRFLDHRVRRYPHLLNGPNARQVFVDTEAVRVLSPPPAGLAGAVDEVWARYGLPLAITEVHNGCTREEQLRWMAEAWQTATEARSAGVDLRAVTAWAVYGSADWNTLLTRKGRYEVGAFDLSGPTPRATALAAMVQSLAANSRPDHPVLEGKGWWQRDIRLLGPALPRPAPIRFQRDAWRKQGGARPLLIAGATGTLGRALAAACQHRGIRYVLTSRAELDLTAEASIASALDACRPWAVINAAGWVRVDEAELCEGACFEANARGAWRLAEAAGVRGIPTTSFSSDLVFSGESTEPYDESGEPAPINAYGRSKAEAERLIAALDGTHLIVRTAAFFSPFDSHNFAVRLCQSLAKGISFAAADDQTITPTYVPDLCNAVLDLIIDGETGFWHLTNADACTWSQFANWIAETMSLDTRLVEARAGIDLNAVAPRPVHVPLISNRGSLMPSLSDALERFGREFEQRAERFRRFENT